MHWEYVSFVLGISLCVIGICLMVEGSILGERTIPAAIVSTLVGICLFATSGARLLKTKKS
jgi:hypothetical protein